MKYEIGTEWKTRGGWRAMIVGAADELTVWHEGFIDQLHDSSGLNMRNEDDSYSSPEEEFDLIEPWKEPIVHEGWFNVYRRSYGFVLGLARPQTKEQCDADHSNFDNRIACVPLNFTEGEGL